VKGILKLHAGGSFLSFSLLIRKKEKVGDPKKLEMEVGWAPMNG
jgi:hypothetical protein